MKTKLKTTVTTAGIIAIIFFSSCGNETKKETTNTVQQAKTDTTANSGQHVYACPMHPEATGVKGDKCPKCEMDLEEVK